MAERHLTEGPQWYRTRVRVWGPLLGLLVPGVVGAIAFFSLQLSDASWSGAVGLIGGYFAAPTLLAVGAPFTDRELYPFAVIASALLWMAVGFLASRRATRNPMATFADYWKHYFWMLGGIWVGVAVALAVATVNIGSGVLDW